MIGFHIDMNIAQFTRAYLEKWLRELARLGYDTIVWEVENNVRWGTCPECVSPDAFSKEEFREILALSRELGLEPVPLLQTIAHCEYVLKHDKYKHLSEIPGEIRQYCPQNREVMEFLHAWIEEYLDLFGDVKCFHLGADEAWWMGSCDKCKAYVDKHSLSDLYIDHVTAVAAPLLSRGVTPIIWADMVLHHNEALDRLPRGVMLFDWMYDIRRGMGKVWVWGREWIADDAIAPDVLERFGAYLFPEGDEPGKPAETFYTADFLAAQGFRVVTCPSSSSYGDNVFSPRNWYHLANTWDSSKKGLTGSLEGTVLTSWTVHLHPWEVQAAMIGVPPYVHANPDTTLADYQRAFVRERFGEESEDFWRACGLLSKRCLFTHTSSLGYDKAALPVAPDHASEAVAKIRDEGRLEDEIANAKARLAEYRAAMALFLSLRSRARGGEELLDAWILAAKNLTNHAEASLVLLLSAGGAKVDATGILSQMRELRSQMDAFYAPIMKPARRGEMITWMFASVEAALASLKG